MIYLVFVTDGMERVEMVYVGTDIRKASTSMSKVIEKYLYEEDEIWRNDPHRPSEPYYFFIEEYKDGGSDPITINRFNRLTDRMEII